MTKLKNIIKLVIYLITILLGNLSENTIQLNYYLKDYILDLDLSPDKDKGKINVYVMNAQTKFNSQPNFDYKKHSIIEFDKNGNVIVDTKILAIHDPSLIEEIIQEIIKAPK